MPGLAAVILIILMASTAPAQETRMLPVTVDGERLRLQMRVYSFAHSRANFAAFQSAGGRGVFHELPAEAGGHYLWETAGSVGSARRELLEASRPAGREAVALERRLSR